MTPLRIYKNKADIKIDKHKNNKYLINKFIYE